MKQYVMLFSTNATGRNWKEFDSLEELKNYIIEYNITSDIEICEVLDKDEVLL